jgi:hypothetical protein
MVSSEDIQRGLTGRERGDGGSFMHSLRAVIGWRLKDGEKDGSDEGGGFIVGGSRIWACNGLKG